MENSVTKSCDICNTGPERSKLIAIENGYPIVECNNCGFIFAKQQPVEEGGKVIGEYYKGDEVSAQYKRYSAVNSFLLNEINSKVPAKGSFLDVGCGYGYLLLHMMADGWKAYGSELSQLAVDFVNGKANRECVFYGGLPELPIEKNSLDVVNMTNVLEHVPSPTRILLECKDLLRPGGFLFVRVPNMEFSFFFRRTQNALKFLGLKNLEFSFIATPPPVHLHGFDQHSLKNIFEKTGYELVEIKPSKLSSGGKTYFAAEIAARIVFLISFKKINICPTILAIARLKNQ
jgi:SAM-dependent methyltransferase